MEKSKTVDQKENKEPMTPKQRTIFVLKIVGNVLFYGVIFVLFLFSIMNINAGRKHGIPNLFGRGYLVVLTDSMDAKKEALPDYYNDYKIKQFKSYQKATETSKAYSGDLLNVQMISKSDINKLKVGDVITYWDIDIEVSDGSKGAFNTHRITYIHKNENGKTDLIYTIGDRDVAIYGLKTPEEIDAMSASERYDYEESKFLDIFGEANFSSIKAKVTSVNYNGAGTVNFIQNNWLFIFVIPIAVILVIEVILVVKNIFDLRREKNKAIDLADHEAQMAELQSEKERMRAELLAELRAQGALPPEEAKEPEPAKVEEPIDAPVEEKEPEVETKEETETVEDATEVENTVEEDKPEVVEKKEEVIESPVENTEEKVEDSTEKTNEEEESVINEEKSDEPDMSIEENEEEAPKAVKKAPAKKSTTAKSSSTTKKTTAKKTTKKAE